MRRPSGTWAWLGLWLALAGSWARGEETDVRESVVKVFATRRAPDLARPWSKQSPQEATGSGVVIAGRRILTNAHVVLYASQIFVQPNESSDKLPATVEAVSPSMDLALLQVADETFFVSRPPLPMAAELPEVKDTASAYGYPLGGTTLSITKGIVSRIELAAYNYQELGLRIQVDTAINPGNSGGPVLVNDAMVGIVFAHHSNAQNIGYIIPNEEINTFLEDVGDGRYEGKLRQYEEYQALENEALRARLQLDKATTGVLVTRPFADRPDYPLQKWDVITRVGTYPIDNAGIVQIKPNLRLRWEYLVPKLAREEKLPLGVWREGKALDVELPVVRGRDQVIKGLKGAYPSYFIYGPLVFSPASIEYLQAIGGATAALSFRGSPLINRWSDDAEFAGEELVLVPGPMFPHRLTRGYGNPVAQVVKSVNGVPIQNLRHLVETLRAQQDRFVEIQFAEKGSDVLIFDRAEITAATEEILSDNGIRQQYSPDLRAAWEPGP
jgi:S1-C subfamily serine protease